MGRTQLASDPKHNIAYLRLHEKKGQVDTIRVSDEMNVDIAPDGTVYGIELLNANAQLDPEDNGNLLVVSEAVGAREVPPGTVREGRAQYGKERQKRRA